MKDFKVINDRPSIVIVNTPAIDVNRLEGEFYKYDYLNAIDKIKKIRFLPLENLVDDIKDGPGGWDINISDYVEQGVPMLRTINIVDGLVNLDECVFIDIEKHKQLKRSRVVKNDVLLSVRGTIGKSAVYSKNFEANINAALVKITLKDNIIDPYFLVAFFNCKYGRLQTERIANGAVQLNMNLTEAKSNLIPIPSPEIQKYIGDKVRKAEELREEAKTLQKEIDILLEVDILLKEETDKVYNIYDSKINWTNEINIEDRIDPNFYQKKYISTIEKLGNNKVRLEKYVRITKIRYQTGNINKYIEISSINNSFGTIDEVEELRPEEIPTSAKYQVKEGDILVSLVRPTRKAISIVTKEYDNAICTGGFAVLQSKGKVPVEFLTAVLRTNFVGIQFERYCAGSTYPTINEDDVVKVFIPMYSENQINKITENYRRIIDNIYTSKKLIEEAKQDVEDLIEGNFDMSKVKANS